MQQGISLPHAIMKSGYSSAPPLLLAWQQESWKLSLRHSTASTLNQTMQAVFKTGFPNKIIRMKDESCPKQARRRLDVPIGGTSFQTLQLENCAVTLVFGIYDLIAVASCPNFLCGKRYGNVLSFCPPESNASGSYFYWTNRRRKTAGLYCCQSRPSKSD